MKARVFLPIAAGLLASSLALAAYASDKISSEVMAKGGDDNACTWFRTIDDWRRLDDSNLIVWGPNKVPYHVQLSMPLFDLSTAESIAFIDGNRDGQLCGFGMDRVVIPNAPIHESSTILGMTRLNDASVAQLDAQYHVKGKRASKPETAAQAVTGDAKSAGAS
jgi:hypothetical protein